MGSISEYGMPMGSISEYGYVGMPMGSISEYGYVGMLMGKNGQKYSLQKTKRLKVYFHSNQLRLSQKQTSRPHYYSFMLSITCT